MRQLIVLLALAGCDGGDDKAETGIPGDTATDTVTDTGDRNACFVDADEDGYGLDSAPCDVDGVVAIGGDCDDSSAAVYPDAPEVCDGVDNDCDDAVDDFDELAPDAGIAHHDDADEDGYGDPKTAERSCDVPSGRIEDGTDCDDSDDAINPGAVERCSGVDDDCDPETTEDGLALFVADSGAQIDQSAVLGAGTSGAPVSLSLIEDGTLRLCAGDWYASLDVSADVDIVGAGQTDTAINASGARSVVSIAVDGATVGLSDLTLLGGQGSGYIATLDSSDGGGGVYCAGQGTTLSVERVALRGNAARVGGGVLLDGCDATFSETSLTTNSAEYYAGGGAFLGGTVTFDDSRFEDNTSDLFAGGLFVVSDSSSATVTLRDTRVVENSAQQAGAMFVLDSTVSCVADDGEAAIVANTSSLGAGAIAIEDYNRSASFSTVGCDLGTDANKDNNAPRDFTVTEADYGDGVTIRCTSGGCAP